MSSQPYSQPARSPRCGIDGCRSRRYHEDNGLWYCARGHLQEGRIEQSQDYEDINWSASQTTRIKDSQAAAETAAKIEALGGSQGRELFLLAFQLVLRKQICLLKTLLGLSQNAAHEFEELAQDLWLMRIECIDEDFTSIGSRNSTDRHDEEEETEAETENETELEDNANGETTVRPPKSSPRLVETITLPYLALTILQHAVPLSTLQAWARGQQLIHINARKAIPTSMRQKLAPAWQTTFEVKRPLPDGSLHQSVAELARMLYGQFATLSIPPLNWAPIFHYYLHVLALPIDIVIPVKQLVEVLDLDFTLDSFVHLGPHGLVKSLPEVQVVALIVMAVKMLYPFEEEPKFTSVSSLPSLLVLNWKEWHKSHKKFAKERCKVTGNQPDPLKLQPEDIPTLSPEQLDGYMDWFQDTFAGLDVNDNDAVTNPKNSDTIPKPILDLFPMGDRRTPLLSHAEARQRLNDLQTTLWQETHDSMLERPTTQDPETSKNGSLLDHYPYYRTVDSLEADKWAKVFHQRVAEMTGIPLLLLIRAVLMMEEKMRRTQEIEADGDEQGASRDNDDENWMTEDEDSGVDSNSQSAEGDDFEALQELRHL